jgi:hypothetical protein
MNTSVGNTNFQGNNAEEKPNKTRIMITAERSPINKQARMILSKGTGRYVELKEALVKVSEIISSSHTLGLINSHLENGMESEIKLTVKKMTPRPGIRIILSGCSKAKASTMIYFSDLQ